MFLSKEDEVVRLAEQLFQRDPSWVVFFREVLGWEGMVMRAFPAAAERAAFQDSPQHTRLCDMLDELRNRTEGPPPRDPTSTITVRLPRPVHESLLQEAAAARISLNRLCIAKLTAVLVASELQKVP